MFTPFRRRWLEFPLPGPEFLLPSPDFVPTRSGIKTLPIPDRPLLPNLAPFKPGEEEWQRRLTAFFQGGRGGPIANYADQRDRMDLEGTSRLSPYLGFGMLSARQVAVAALQARAVVQDGQGVYAWLSELIWRELYIAILYYYPQVLRQNFRSVYDGIVWRNDKGQYAAWYQGFTGYPAVNAAMRQLVQIGWIHNRARMIVASFLVKDLLIDWRWGERYFMEHLVDGDPAANNGGWQWTAGTGTDAAPYFRIFNPVLQGKKSDPQGDYVR